MWWKFWHVFTVHMFWSCPRIARFWREVVELINHLTLPISPELALLGILDDQQRPRYTKLLIADLLYFAKREIILKWNACSSPSVDSWGKNLLMLFFLCTNWLTLIGIALESLTRCCSRGWLRRRGFSHRILDPTAGWLWHLSCLL